MVRIFVGTLLDVNDQQHLVDFPLLNLPTPTALRWVSVNKLHLTWAFLGEVPEDNLTAVQAELRQTIAAAASGSLQIVYTKVALWPSAKKASHLALVPEVVPPDVKLLADTICAKVLTLAAVPDGKPFRPHITLARLNAAHALVATGHSYPVDWPQFDKFLPFGQKLTRIQLIKSHLGSGLNHYEVLDEVALNA